ncbi:unnamed protein product [Closterium sp. NIES-53]
MGKPVKFLGPTIPLVPARSALALSGPARTVSRCPAATRTACPRTSRPAALPSTRRLVLQPAPSCPAARASRCPALRPARRPALQLASRTALPCSPARRARLLCPARASLSCALRPAAARASRLAALHSARPAALSTARPALQPAARPALPSPPPSRPAATTAAAAAARATAAAGGGAAGSAGGAAGAGGAGPTTDRHCLSWPLSRQLQRLGVDSSSHCLSRTTPPLSSFSATAPGAGESAAALCASASTVIGPTSAEVLHTFTLDSGASQCFFRDCTTITPLAAPVPVSLADPTGGLVVARASTVLPCPTVPSVSLSGLHLPSFLTNLLSNAVLYDEWADTFIPGGQCVAICKCSRTSSHLAKFTRQPGSGLNTLTTASAQMAVSSQVAALSQVSVSGQLAASCSCRVLPHQTLLWHHHLGHPSLSRLRIMHSRLLVSGLPRSLPSLPRLPAPPWLPCVKGRQRAAPHSSEFPPTIAPLQTLHMDVWGPAPVSGTDQEHYFLLVVDDYTRYTTVPPLRRKADVSGVLIPWIRATRRQLRERFCRDLPLLLLHSVRGGEFSSGLLGKFFRDDGIRQTFTLSASPQQNGIAECRIGLIMEVARTSMIHAAAPHFLWPFAVRYAAHQLNLWPRVSEPETSPTLRWTGKVGDA